MTQYLIRQFEDSTGHIHTSVEKVRKNETLSIVEAESKEETKGLIRYAKPPKANWNWLEKEYKKIGIFDKEGD
ncbi:DUF1381 domain-containing protein [Staphylococcus caprae]|uniref:DUF1381 domain-containing protein n=1 Tax=Staphylococcus caprae TaxID=29380 RepID=UPI003B2206D2